MSDALFKRSAKTIGTNVNVQNERDVRRMPGWRDRLLPRLFILERWLHLA